MKTLYGTIDTHLEGSVTSLCTCWKITRKSGETQFFTDADTDIIIDADTYYTAGAYRRSAISNTATLSVDNLEIEGITSDMHLSYSDMVNGLYDYAEVDIFVTSWHGGDVGKIKLRRGYFGSVTVDSNGIFKVELRGLLQKLAHIYTDVYSVTCNNDLGDSLCSIPISPKRMIEGETFALNAIGVIPVSGKSYGDVYTGGVTDGGFTEAYTSTLASSPYWESSVTFSITADSSSSSGYAASSSSAGTLLQNVSLQSTSVPVNSITHNGVNISLTASRKDSGSPAELSLSFYDSDNTELMHGQRFLGNGSGTSVVNVIQAGNWTVEAWVLVKEDLLATDFLIDGTTNIAITAGKLALTSGSTTILEIDTAIDDGEWHHVAITSNGTTVKAYVDFTLKETITTLHTLDYTSIAAASTYIDELRIWSTTRTISELFQNAYSTIDPTDIDLLRYYNFNGGSLLDATGNDVNALINGTLVDYSSPVAVPVGSGVFVASTSTGSEDVGAAWVRRTLDARVPSGTVYYTISMAASAAGSELGDVWVSLKDTSTDTENPESHNNLYWKATVDNAVVPAGYPPTPASGSTFGDFVAEESWSRSGTIVASVSNSEFTLEVTDSRAVDGWFNFGHIVFTSGLNTGGAFEVKDWIQATGVVQLYLPTNFSVELGDEFYIFPGCEKTRINCAAIYNNVLNFNGTPDVPGHDELFRYPDAT